MDSWEKALCVWSVGGWIIGFILARGQNLPRRIIVGNLASVIFGAIFTMVIR